MRHRTDYIDITGEPEFMERMAQLYHDEAVAEGVLVLPSSGFDCVRVCVAGA